MCSIVGYVGLADNRDVIFSGLSRLEYRGYDSAGYAWIDASKKSLSHAKTIGSVEALRAKTASVYENSFSGIGHTRWATHGKATDGNAHPHFDCTKTIGVVHNGTIENFAQLKAELVFEGHQFSSETDTEIIAHLFESLFAANTSIHSTLVHIVNRLQGAYTCIVLSERHPDTIIAIRRKSPLCIGMGTDGQHIASDPFAFTEKTNKVLFLPDESFAFITASTVQVYDFSGNVLSVRTELVVVEQNDLDKKGHPHFMVKEIFEHRDAIYRTIHSRENDTRLLPITFNGIKKMHIIACGTSWHAALMAKYFFEQVAQVETVVHLASEFRHYSLSLLRDQAAYTAYFFVSQSGETADTLEALRMVTLLDPSVQTYAVTNVPTSTIAREATTTFVTKAGREVAVASTKTFTAQVALLYWLAHYLACQKGIISEEDRLKANDAVYVVAHALEETIMAYKDAIDTHHAPLLSQKKQILFLGRHISYALALETALKCNELTYIFSLAYPTGELKHGPLALLDQETPVVLISHQDPVIYQKILINAQEIRARSEQLIVFAYAGQDELIALANTVFIAPKARDSLLGPLVFTGLVQYLTYAMACCLGRPVDKPRNLAKSVTVE